jgi:hypothetical protein
MQSFRTLLIAHVKPKVEPQVFEQSADSPSTFPAGPPTKTNINR